MTDGWEDVPIHCPHEDQWEHPRLGHGGIEARCSARRPDGKEDDRTPAERRLVAQIASNLRWAREADRVAATDKMRRGFEERFFRLAREEAEKQGVVLTQREIAIRAESLRKVHYQRMALKSAQARRKRVRRKED
jgi:hypothetical protein